MTDTRTRIDARPRLRSTGGHAVVVGSRCVLCALPTAERLPGCPRCGGVIEPEEFGPGGTVWSWTTVHLAVGGREPGHTLAYLDLDDGPRILVLLNEQAAVGRRAVITHTDLNGDIVAHAEEAP